MIVKTIVVVAVLYLSFTALLYSFQRKITFNPSPEIPSIRDAGIKTFQQLRIKTSDGLENTAWYSPALKAAPTIVYFQGNAGNIAERAYKAKLFIDQGYGFLFVGYRGYNGDDGQPTEQGLYRDAKAALDFLRQQDISTSRWILYGESLGTGVAVEMAADLAKSGTPVKAVILETPYTSLIDIALNRYPVIPAQILLKDRFENDAKIKSIDTPVMIFHGDQDRVIPQFFGKKLFDLANQPKTSVWIKGGAHGDLYEWGAYDYISSFIKSLGHN